jgi:hypothetical protein
MRKLLLGLLAAIVFSGRLASGFAATTIDAANNCAYGANLGWINWVGDTNNGAVIGEYVCSGSIYSANVGWISLGSGSPTNGIQYQNLSANDFGVNHDGLGNLRGYAYGANIGWLNFETNGAPKVDLLTGQLGGYVWSANCGWISLSNAVAYVQTDTISQGMLAPDGLPVAWLLLNFGTTNVDADADADGDGMSNEQEYLAGTDPNDAGSNLKITGYTIQPGGTNVSLTWNSMATRFYRVQKSPDLSGTNWTDSGLGIISPNPVATTGNFTDAAAAVRFYRVKVVLPLSP